MSSKDVAARIIEQYKQEVQAASEVKQAFDRVKSYFMLLKMHLHDVTDETDTIAVEVSKEAIQFRYKDERLTFHLLLDRQAIRMATLLSRDICDGEKEEVRFITREDLGNDRSAAFLLDDKLMDQAILGWLARNAAFCSGV